MKKPVSAYEKNRRIERLANIAISLMLMLLALGLVLLGMSGVH